MTLRWVIWLAALPQRWKDLSCWLIFQSERWPMDEARRSRCYNCHEHQAYCLGACGVCGFKRWKHSVTSFFAKGRTIISRVDLHLQSVAHAWMARGSAGWLYVLEQDDALTQNSHLAQNYCDENMDMFWLKNYWPSSFPDLNALDYYWWCVFERKFKNIVLSSIVSSRAFTIDACRNADRQLMANACNQFRSRNEAVTEWNCSHLSLSRK